MSVSDAFKCRLTDEETLRDLLGSPSQLVSNKVVTRLDRHCQAFIGLSPLVMVATSNGLGQCDVSPRGGTPGFALILDEQRLVLPELPGNRRLDSLRNILSNANIGLNFLIPGMGETLRVNGHACVTTDPDLLERMTVNGKVPVIGIGVEVQECYLHCAKAFLRSRLWDPASWPTPAALPNPAQILADHANVQGVGVEDVQRSLLISYANRL